MQGVEQMLESFPQRNRLGTSLLFLTTRNEGEKNLSNRERERILEEIDGCRR